MFWHWTSLSEIHCTTHFIWRLDISQNQSACSYCLKNELCQNRRSDVPNYKHDIFDRIRQPLVQSHRWLMFPPLGHVHSSSQHLILCWHEISWICSFSIKFLFIKCWIVKKTQSFLPTETDYLSLFGSTCFELSVSNALQCRIWSGLQTVLMLAPLLGFM